jgi:two-component system, cell cycle response regulator DivK
VKNHPSGSRRPRRILIVEDHDDTRLLYGLHFERGGYHVETAAGGNEGIAVALRMQPDVIVLDLTMPSLDGWDTVALLRAYPTTAAVPIIACTGVDHADALTQARVAGCNEVIKKPCFPEDVEKAVDELLGDDWASRTA